MASNAMVAPVAVERVGEVVEEALRRRVADVHRALVAQELRLLVAAHDVDELDRVGETQPVEHLAEVGGGRGVDQRRVSLAPHRADHAERGERVDEARRALFGCHAVGQGQDLRHVDAPVLGVRRPAEHADRSAEQCLGRR